ncbi:MAG: hypothetical protein US95_C0044G0006 [Candidatus Woesebacteria bacterium GW2011_GWB1_38_5]|uniref:HTH cro/C1-type domain-containing protein n=4 Tax=Candidatus Woeseibacteriota TaxID=1752722 RepID=A0A0G0KWR0_9BACT|nr:MAG: hypothetical protein US67_C0032G0004 [Candidatus Woesebacteria bacterium GW2011_GWD1_38_10]KKQ56309.1 MAG: hypothetical protein US75_C0007G0015 [Candidatus Woesebacteria bacterium GW2011_GWC1_38_13]KKQ73830.1 MAG: hypothetical protein US95_C0044G0006 [Candidatus Woesebacteria bacterium GW2011_GWB1_38_5]KKQ76288.1 MAG: hypothetical protein US97_C0014G0006 [Microgenomates group bacterium GW2011_GWF1_38_5]KKQ84088.1 MAG: hypothetical protein UT06_C0011G0077 [Candidatus Woesebacteria bacter
MKKLGSYLKEARVKKKLTLKDLESETKIKKTFLSLIEKGVWDELPEYHTTLGFVKTIAKSLNLPEENTVALLRRDYPIEDSKNLLYPKPDVKLKVSFSPKLAAIFFSTMLILLLIAYLGYQYILYVSPPKLLVHVPAESQEILVGETEISGKTDPDVTLSINEQRFLINENGEFFGKLGVNEDTKEIVFIARSRYGKETVVVRNIIPKKE